MHNMTPLKTIAVIGGTGHQGPGLALRWARSGRYQVGHRVPPGGKGRRHGGGAEPNIRRGPGARAGQSGCSRPGPMWSS